MQMLIIFFAVTHGVNGLRMVIEDYIGANRLRIFLRGLLFLFWMFMLIVAYFVILTV
jgi:succinate dehydrogenase hydrophobic anchor subunit